MMFMAVPISVINSIHIRARKNKVLTAKVSLVLAIVCLLGNFLPSFLNSKIITDKKEYTYKEYTYKGYDKVREGSGKHSHEFIYIYVDELPKPLTVSTSNDYVNLSVLKKHKSGEKIQVYLEEWDAPKFSHYAHEIVIEGEIALSFEEDIESQIVNNNWLYVLFNMFALLFGLIALVFYLEYKGVKLP